MSRVSKRRSGQPEMRWWQRANVRRAGAWSVVVIGGGWVVSKVLVIDERERREVEAAMKAHSHEGSQLYEIIRRSEERRERERDKT